MQDEIDKLIESLEDFYPGSKKRRRTLSPEVEERRRRQAEEGAWDSNPMLKQLPNGKTIELFSAGAFASALGRPLVTIRLWERRGYIPRAPYRLKPGMLNGKKVPGWRLYSREIVEATLASFRSRDLLEAPRIEWDQHHDLTIELVESWSRIHTQETA